MAVGGTTIAVLGILTFMALRPRRSTDGLSPPAVSGGGKPNGGLSECNMHVDRRRIRLDEFADPLIAWFLEEVHQNSIVRADFATVICEDGFYMSR